MDRQKDEMMEKQAEELEKVKIELKNKALDEQHRQEIVLLREELTKLQTKHLIDEEESKKPSQMYASNMSSNYNSLQNAGLTVGSNPFATQNIPSKVGRNAKSPDRQQKPASKLEELQELRENLVRDMHYSESDDIIIEIDSNIRRLQKTNSPAKK